MSEEENFEIDLDPADERVAYLELTPSGILKIRIDDIFGSISLNPYEIGMIYKALIERGILKPE